ncbi:MAG: SMI1/KNR4 family protein [Bacteroidia bacterium]|nr:SMI1/KNR4 family protein [Bacteroidia bacterium]
MITFSQTKLPLISQVQIDEIEQITGLSLPEEYKNHLLTYNGGRCHPNRFSFYENGKITSSAIDWFLAIYEGKYNNLKTYINSYKMEEKRLPQHILPIARDPGGNLVCISCMGEDFGYIYFWDHEKEVDFQAPDHDEYSNLYLVAKTFQNFLDELQ